MIYSEFVFTAVFTFYNNLGLDKYVDCPSDITFIKVCFFRDVAVTKELIFLMPAAGHSDYKKNNPDLGAIKG